MSRGQSRPGSAGAPAPVPHGGSQRRHAAPRNLENLPAAQHGRRLVRYLARGPDCGHIGPVEKRTGDLPVGGGLPGDETEFEAAPTEPFEIAARARRSARHQQLRPAGSTASQPAFPPPPGGCRCRRSSRNARRTRGPVRGNPAWTVDRRVSGNVGKRPPRGSRRPPRSSLRRSGSCRTGSGRAGTAGPEPLVRLLPRSRAKTAVPTMRRRACAFPRFETAVLPPPAAAAATPATGTRIDRRIPDRPDRRQAQPAPECKIPARGIRPAVRPRPLRQRNARAGQAPGGLSDRRPPRPDAGWQPARGARHVRSRSAP